MPYRSAIAAITLVAASCVPLVSAEAHDETKYPDWKGSWMGGWSNRAPGVTGHPSYDPLKSDGRGQHAPLTAEYQAIHEASLADQANGVPGNDPPGACLTSRTPRTM